MVILLKENVIKSSGLSITKDIFGIITTVHAIFLKNSKDINLFYNNVVKFRKMIRGVSMAENKDKQSDTKKKEIGLFIAKTLFYFAVLVVLVYLYSYSGIGAAKFIYKDF